MPRIWKNPEDTGESFQSFESSPESLDSFDPKVNQARLAWADTKISPPTLKDSSVAEGKRMSLRDFLKAGDTGESGSSYPELIDSNLPGAPRLLQPGKRVRRG